MIYLDHHAATPVVAASREAMFRASEIAWANPSSPHAVGRAARTELEAARRRVASSLGVAPARITFTSGGSEACQSAVEGLVLADSAIDTIVTTTIEHPAIARSVDRLEASGLRVVRLGVGPKGIEVDAFRPHLKRGVLVAAQWVNHELGLILPIEELARACRLASALLAVDATQALGKLPVDLGSLGATAVALASTKVGGPAGSGALVLEAGAGFEPRLLGGGQERGLRGGTQDLLAHIGFGAAAEQAGVRLASMPEVSALRDELEAGLVARGALVNGALAERVATCTNVSFVGRRATVLAAALDLEGVAVATGPACSSGLDTPSPTVLSIYPDEPERARSALRFSLAPSTTHAEVVSALEAVDRVFLRVSRA